LGTGDTTLSKTELRAVASAGELSSAACDALLAMADSNRNGAVSLPELLELQATLREVETLNCELSS
jgi:hypothetical protein